ncbi:translation initiation factor 4E [Hamiltosporidium tvaerminnensis]|uniref:Translation initiation factor 4E n=2 Tax=Hamiltosporidium TaxID=1176354 RepID=A0A4Q9LEK8_9MICR|nr:Eukaryotic translation initiation factor 4E type 2 [Hamiltosporidium tvaerminnensis]TBT96942.1 translation initiation factor 4E [Hamiltosporidium tvaerminnensis]TBU06407.1 translation initiation factor 4E [Hamiltosporidium magnivora]
MNILFTTFEITTVNKSGFTKPLNDDFRSTIRHICTLKTIENLGYFLRYLKPIESCESVCDINVFKQGIQPLWEDENNLGGGKWIIKLRKEVGHRLLERLIIHLIKGPFSTTDVNGVVASIRPKFFILSIWTRTCPKTNEVKNIIKEIRNLLKVGNEVEVCFKDNDESLRDNSSFKNTTRYTEN